MMIAMGFVPTTDSSTLADFDRAAGENARAFWYWFISAVFVWWGASLWWAAVPAAVALHAAIAWISCTRQAQLLRNEMFRMSVRKKTEPSEQEVNSSEWKKEIQKIGGQARSDSFPSRIASASRDLDAA